MNRIRCFMVSPVYSESKKLRDGGPATDHWVRPDTGETQRSPHLFGPGAMWIATWLMGDSGGRWHPGPDGNILIVETPGGSWNIDSRASNCDRRDDHVHHCWIRHGEPPNITVDKNGDTCGAGAGSIQCGSYHGFLRNGHLEQC